MRGDQDVGGLEVAVDDPLAVGVLDRLADREEQFQPVAGRELLLVAVVDDRDALDQLHDEVGPAAFRRAGVEDAGDVGVVHQRQRLPLRLEAGDDVARVHARLDDLQGHLAANGVLLLGDEDQAHPSLADLLHQLIGADQCARAFGDWLVIGGCIRGKRPAHEFAGFAVIPEQTFELGPQAKIRAASLVKIRGASRRGLDLQGATKNRFHVGRGELHRPASKWGCSTLNATCRRGDCKKNEENFGSDSGWGFAPQVAEQPGPGVSPDGISLPD